VEENTTWCLLIVASFSGSERGTGGAFTFSFGFAGMPSSLRMRLGTCTFAGYIASADIEKGKGARDITHGCADQRKSVWRRSGHSDGAATDTVFQSMPTVVLVARCFAGGQLLRVFNAMVTAAKQTD
jgi:hypothetical protein